MGKWQDITGTQVNTLTVDSYLGNSLWACTCTVCGRKLRRQSNGLHAGTACCPCQRYVVHHPSRKRIDLVGKRFGRLTVTKYAGDERWLCRCECGQKCSVNGANLRKGKTTSCGCFHVDKLHMPRHDLTGQVYGDLTVLGYAGRSRWRCMCVCGQTTTLYVSKLKEGRRCTHYGTSRQEKEINDIVRRCARGDVQAHKRILDGKEVDIFVPDVNLAIEVNGSATHASVNGAYRDLPVDYHLRKYRAAVESGVHLVQVFNVNYDLRRQAVLAYLQYLVCPQVESLELYTVRQVTRAVAEDLLTTWSPSFEAVAGDVSWALMYGDNVAAVLSGNMVNAQFVVTGYAAAYSVSWVGAAKLLLATVDGDVTWPVDIDWFTDTQMRMLGFTYTGVHQQRVYFSRDDKLLTTEQVNSLTAACKRVCTVYRCGVDVYTRIQPKKR